MCWDVTSCLVVSEEPVASILGAWKRLCPCTDLTARALLLLPRRLICLVTDTKCTSYTAVCGVLCIANALYLPKVRKHDGGSVFVRGSTMMSDCCDRQTHRHATPGRLNQTRFSISRPCILYGQCRHNTHCGCHKCH
jgi:hypothetical protein